MFEKCSLLQEINLSNKKTKVNNMSKMFYYCINLSDSLLDNF